MTLIRVWRLGAAITFATLLVLTAFVWGNQRHAQAQTVPDGGDIAHAVFCYLDGLGSPTDVFDEPGCAGHGGHVAQCNDGIDNDADGFTDYPADPGCSSASDDSESPDPSLLFQCMDGIDNDGDHLIDIHDPGCHSDGNANNPLSYSTTDDSEADSGTPPAQCQDGIDNDGDGLVDMADPGCSSPTDNDESNGGGTGSTTPQCADTIDNDADGFIDAADPGCHTDGVASSTSSYDPTDNDETDATSTNNGGGTSTTTDNGGGGGGGGHHRSGSSGSLIGGEVLGASTGPTDCPMYLVGYIRYGAHNDQGEVLKLQTFLNDFEGNALTLSGVYDAATFAAVKAYQAKYASDILSPWSLKGSTGYVYYTTQKKINEEYCKGDKAFPLSVSQIQEIAQVKPINQSGKGAQVAQNGAPNGGVAAGTTVMPLTGDQNAVGGQGDKSQTAAAANASSTQGWWQNFTHWLFGR